MVSGTWAVTASVAVLTAGLSGCGASHPVAAETPSSTTATPSLPPMKHFRIGYPEGPVQDCSVDGSTVTCALSVVGPSSVESYSGTVTGTLSGLTLTGTSVTHQRFRDEADPACILEMDKSEPVEYVFGLDGVVTMHGGPADVHTERSGSCSGTESAKDWRWEDSAPWSATDR